MKAFQSIAAAALLVAGVAAGPSDDIDTLSHMIDKTNQLRTHSLAPPYVDSDLQNRWWDFGGDAIINTNKHVRLTQDKPSQKGWLWSRMPLSVLNWQVEVEFKVDGKAHNLFGDGFAIWLSKDRAKLGSVFGSVDYFTGLGIFFDTYANSRHSYSLPRVTIMNGDGKTAYDHAHDNAENELAACSENFRRKDFPTKARLTYLRNKFLQLKLQNRKSDEWITCFEVEVSLPDSPYLGFSAETGDVSDAHDIVSVNTYSLSLKPEYRGTGGYQAAVAQGQQKAAATSGKADSKQAPLLNTKTTPVKNKREKSKKSSGGGGVGSVFLLLLKGIAVLAFIAFCAAAYRTYNAEQRSRRTW